MDRILANTAVTRLSQATTLADGKHAAVPHPGHGLPKSSILQDIHMMLVRSCPLRLIYVPKVELALLCTCTYTYHTAVLNDANSKLRE